MSLLPETLTYIGISVFAVLSLVACDFLAGKLADLLPAFYLFVAFIGIGEMYLMNALFQASVDVKNNLSLVYLATSIACIGFTIYVTKQASQSTRKLTYIRIRGKWTWRLRDRSGRFVKGTKEYLKSLRGLKSQAY